MNRRRLLQAFAAATFAAVVEVTGIQPTVEAPGVLEVNPEYLTAEYEDVFIYRTDTNMQRFQFENETYVEVPKYKFA